MKVASYGSLGVITTLEFFQHHFSEMGHRDLLVTQTYLSRQATTVLRASRVASAAGRLGSNGVMGSLRAPSNCAQRFCDS